MVGKDKKSVVVQFVSYLKKASIFPNVKKLKGSGVAVTNDLCFEDREERKILQIHQKQAREQNLEAKIRRSLLIIGENTYTVEDLNKLDKKATSYTDTELEDSPEETEEEDGKNRDKGQTPKQSENTTNKEKRKNIDYRQNQKRNQTGGGNTDINLRSKKR